MSKIETIDIDDYITVEEDNDSYDSDKIDSDIEAELYGSIHHEASPRAPQDNQIEHSRSISIVSEQENAVEVEHTFVSNGVSDNGLNLKFQGKNRNSVVQDLKNRNMPKKRKSTVIAGILNNIQSHTELRKKKQKTRNQKDRFKSTNLTSRTMDDSDSDSDSVIFIDSDDLSELQTNIEEEIHHISSDSDQSSIEDKFSFITRNHFSNYSSVGTSAGDPWYINTKDLFRSKKASNRYHESSNLNCSNCNKKGHIAKYCLEAKVVKCFICGGMHNGYRCEARVCTRCLQYGHDKFHCFLPNPDCSKNLCNLCFMPGHVERDCPDKWRRYHLTTSGEEIVIGSQEFQTSPIYCYNCGHQGHFGFKCKVPRNRGESPLCPYVISYENPKFPFHNIKRNAFPIPHQRFPMPNQLIKPVRNKYAERKRRQRGKKEEFRSNKNKTRNSHNSQLVDFSGTAKPQQVQSKYDLYSKAMKKGQEERELEKAKPKDKLKKKFQKKSKKALRMERQARQIYHR